MYWGNMQFVNIKIKCKFFACTLLWMICTQIKGILNTLVSFLMCICIFCLDDFVWKSDKGTSKCLVPFQKILEKTDTFSKTCSDDHMSAQKDITHVVYTFKNVYNFFV